MSESFKLRDLEEKDLDLVLEWRNQDRIRAISKNKKTISKEDHYAWFNKIKDDLSDWPLVFEKDGKPIGFVRFFDIDHGTQTAKWSFYLGEEEHKGLGTIMCDMAIKHLRENLGVKTILAEVVMSNERSMKFHEKFKFQYTHGLNGVAHYELHL